MEASLLSIQEEQRSQRGFRGTNTEDARKHSNLWSYEFPRKCALYCFAVPIESRWSAWLGEVVKSYILHIEFILPRSQDPVCANLLEAESPRHPYNAQESSVGVEYGPFSGGKRVS
jgi:hypothetical protein